MEGVRQGCHLFQVAGMDCVDDAFGGIWGVTDSAMVVRWLSLWVVWLGVLSYKAQWLGDKRPRTAQQPYSRRAIFKGLELISDRLAAYTLSGDGILQC